MSLNGKLYDDSHAQSGQNNGSSHANGTAYLPETLVRSDRPVPQRRVLTTASNDPLASINFAPKLSKRRYLTQVLKTAAPLAVADLLSLLIAAILASSLLRFCSLPVSLNMAAVFPFLALVSLLVFSLLELYPGVSMTPITELRLVFIGTIIVFLGFIGATLVDAAYVNTLLLCVTCGFSICLIATNRSIARTFLARIPIWGQPVLVFGENGNGTANYQYLKRNPRLGLRPIGIVGESWPRSANGNGSALTPEDYLGPLEAAETVAVERSVYWAVVAMPARSPNDLRDLIERHACTIPHVLVVPEMDELASLWKRARDCTGVPAVRMQAKLLLPLPRLLKRSLDVTAVLAGGLIALPLVAVIAVLIKLTSPGPIFYGQERITRGGRRFRAWKFRTMVENADQVLQDYLAADPVLRAEWERDEKLKQDPRVTRVGAWLRKTSLDELPQIWNVLVGDMSLVGPRPIVTGEANRYRDSIGLYMKVLPGITGLWQISGRNDTTFGERLDLDSYYVRNWSLWLDLYILTRTAKVVITGEGAY